MALNIQNIYIKTYEQTVRHLAQQSNSRLRMYITERSTNGTEHNWERIGKVEAEEKTSARTPTPAGPQDNDWSRRVSAAKTYHIGSSSEQEDPVQMLVDPNSNIAMSQGMGMRRRVDDVIIAAADGTALDGQGANNAFPAGQIVGDIATPISFDLVTQVNEVYQLNDIDPDIPKVMIVGPTQVRKMLQMTEVTSSDYQHVKALAGNGFVPHWMGFTWILSNRLISPAGDNTDLHCLSFTRMGVGLQMNKDITARVAEDPSLSFAWRIYCHMTLGAVRVEDEHVVRMIVKNSLT
jgi:hypothetical protein